MWVSEETLKAEGSITHKPWDRCVLGMFNEQQGWLDHTPREEGNSRKWNQSCNKEGGSHRNQAKHILKP